MLPDITHFLIFITATLLLNLTPGADVMYIASQSLQNKKQGLMAALGISTGILLYLFATACGLTEILRHSALAFNLIKFGGALYLLYLAWKALTSAEEQPQIKKAGASLLYKSYYRGVCTNILNPKIGLFFLTFLPQFIDAGSGHVSLQLFTLGFCFIVSGTCINILYVFFFSHLKERIFSRFCWQKYLHKLTAFVFFMIAAKVLTVQQAP